MKKQDLHILKDAASRYLRNRREKARTGLYPLEDIILYVTMRCNAKCDHCFCWEDLNIGIPEMSVEQFERMAETMPPVRKIVMTGGEPTLRKELPAIFAAFASRGKAETIHVNSNGLKPDLVEQIVHACKEPHPHTGLDFQISIDGLEETHDRIRGVPGNYKKAVESLRRVYALRSRYPALSAHVLTVITGVNHTELLALNDALRAEVSPDIVHGFELVRDVERSAWNIPEEIREKGVGPKAMEFPPVESHGQIARDLRTIQKRMGASPFHIHNLAQLDMMRTGKPQFRCVTAGQSVAVVYSNGDVAHCEFTLPFANMKDFDFDFERLWLSDPANARRAQITGCHCTHGCFHGKAVEYSAMGLLRTAKSAL